MALVAHMEGPLSCAHYIWRIGCLADIKALVEVETEKPAARVSVQQAFPESRTDLERVVAVPGSNQDIRIHEIRGTCAHNAPLVACPAYFWNVPLRKPVRL